MSQPSQSSAQQALIDFDHTAFAVHDALACAADLRRRFGATPILGETLEEFRYLTMYIGSAKRGSRVEFLEPTGDGFLRRYLTKRGESPHHLTFSVPNVRHVVAAVRDYGFGVVDEHYVHPAWHEAFIRPDATHRTIIQLASSDRSYPSAHQLLTSTQRDAESMPHLHGATDRDWWTPLWQTQPGDTRHIGPTVLRSTDMATSETLFGTILHGKAHDSRTPGGVLYTWPGGALEVVPSDTPGIAGIQGDGSSNAFLAIGSTATDFRDG